MKYINDYTNEEILQLTDEDIERIIKIGLANTGLKLPKKPEEPVYNEILEGDLVLYKVSRVEFLFEKKETAEEVAKLLRDNFVQLKTHDYDWTLGTNYHFVKALSLQYPYTEESSSITVIEQRFFSNELYQQIKDKLNQNAVLRKQYETEEKEYDKAYADAKDISNYVYDKVRAVKEEQYRKDDKLRIFKEYLSLAENDTEIAWKFMKKAYIVSQEEEDYIKANIG